jgi:hypothetical protein
MPCFYCLSGLEKPPRKFRRALNVHAQITISIDLHQNLLLNNIDSTSQLALPSPQQQQQQQQQQLHQQQQPGAITLSSSSYQAPTSAADLTQGSVMTPRMTPVNSLSPALLSSYAAVSQMSPNLSSLQPLTLSQIQNYQNYPQAFVQPQPQPAGYSCFPQSFSPYHVQLAAAAAGAGSGQMVQPVFLTYDGSAAGGAASAGSAVSFMDPRTNLATKIKGGYMLASFAKGSNKYSPY